MERLGLLTTIANIAANSRKAISERLDISQLSPPAPPKRRLTALPSVDLPKVVPVLQHLKKIGIPQDSASALSNAYREGSKCLIKTTKAELKSLWQKTIARNPDKIEEATQIFESFSSALLQRLADALDGRFNMIITVAEDHLALLPPAAKPKWDKRWVPLLIWVFNSPYGVGRYPSELQKQSLADQTGLSYRQIAVWFQNRRARTKKRLAAGKPVPQDRPLSDSFESPKEYLVGEVSSPLKYTLSTPAQEGESSQEFECTVLDEDACQSEGSEEQYLDTGDTFDALYSRVSDDDQPCPRDIEDENLREQYLSGQLVNPLDECISNYDEEESRLSERLRERKPTEDTEFIIVNNKEIRILEHEFKVLNVTHPHQPAEIEDLCNSYAGIKVGPQWCDIEDENGEVYRAKGSDTDSDLESVSDSGNERSPEEASDPDVLHPFSIHTFAYRDACLAGYNPDFKREVDVVDYQQPNDDAPEEDNMSGSGSSGLESSHSDYRTSDDDVPAADEEIIADPESNAPDEEERSKIPTGFWSTSGFYFTEDHPGVEDVEREDINEMAHRPDMDEVLMEPRGVFERRRSRKKKKPKVPLPLPDCFNIPFIPAIADIALQETIEQWGLNTRNNIPKEPEYDHLQGLRQYWTPEYTQDIPSLTAEDPIAAVTEYYNRSGLEDHFLVLEDADVNYLENGWPRPNYSVTPVILDAVENIDVPAWNIVETDYHSVVPIDANPALLWNPGAARSDMEVELQGEYGKMAMYLNPEPELWPTEIIPSWKYEEPPVINSEEDFMAYLNSAPTVVEVLPPVDPLLEDPRPLPSIILATAQPETISTEPSGQSVGFEFDKASADFFAMFTGHEFSGSVSTEPVLQPQEKANRPLPQLSLPSEDADDTEVSAPGFIDWLIGLVSGLPKSSPQQSCAQPILPSDEVPPIAPVDPIAQLILDPITLPSFDFTPIVALDVPDDFFSSFDNPIPPTLW